MSGMSVPERIRSFNAGRDPERLRLKYKAMRKGPFPFLRGTCHLFYEDWPTRSRLNGAPLAWLCGDLHLENFGTFKGDNGLEYFDLNDFDEAILAPCTWDITRLATSTLVGAKSLKWSPAEATALCAALLQAYSATLAEGKARWIERDTAEGMVRDLLDGLRARTSVELLDKVTTKRRGAPKFRYGKRALPVAEPDRRRVTHLLRIFARTQPNPAFFRVRAVARRIAGTGSLGLERYVILVEGHGSPNRNALLDLKIAQPSALAPYVKVPQPRWSSPAARVVAVQERLQAASPARLHAVTMGGTSYILRALQPKEDRLDLKATHNKVRRLRAAVATMGQVTAWAHLRASGRQTAPVADTLMTFGQRKDWHRWVMEYAEAYSHRVERDWEAFRRARAEGFFKSQCETVQG